MEIRKLTPHIGAEVLGVDLAQPLSEDTFKTVHDAIIENCVILFRDQQLTVEQHKPGAQPVLAPAREPARELARHSLARQHFTRACRRHDGGRVADLEQRVEVVRVDGAQQKPRSAELERHVAILRGQLTATRRRIG